jgi:hypothetical protein
MSQHLAGYVHGSCLTDLDDYSSEQLCGGGPLEGGRRAPSVTTNVNVSPTIFVAPLLRSASNSFNFFGNRGSFNGSNNLVVLG